MPRKLFLVWSLMTVISATALWFLAAFPVRASLGDLINYERKEAPQPEDLDSSAEVPAVLQVEEANVRGNVATRDSVESEAVDREIIEMATLAGFTDPQPIPSSDELFALPTRYYLVAEDASVKEPAWGEIGRVLAVLVYRPDDHLALSAAPRRIVYREYDSRYQARFSKDGFYVVVTGPDHLKVADLAKRLEARALTGLVAIDELFKEWKDEKGSL